MTKHESTGNASATSLEALVANTCFCKLKTSCSDKYSSDCMRHKNIYAEFMQQKSEATKR